MIQFVNCWWLTVESFLIKKIKYFQANMSKSGVL